LAGIPTSITALATSYLDILESQDAAKQTTVPFLPIEKEKNTMDKTRQKIQTLLNSYNLNEITPLQALQLLTKIKADAKK
jgi:DNA mismatch repair ATPase MutS